MFFKYVECLKIHQLKIIKLTAKTTKKVCGRHQSLSKQEKEKKSDNMAVKGTKIYQKIKNEYLLSIEKIL